MKLSLHRWFRFASVLALASAGGIGVGGLGCSAEPGPTSGSSDDITAVSHTKVKEQSIGNCWLYATASWAEALNKSATGADLDISESWLTYWHWYVSIEPESTEILTGGTFLLGEWLIEQVGIVQEADFITTEGSAIKSDRQAAALKAMNASLATGALRTAAARQDKKLVRRELDKAWGLSAETIKRIDTVFGADGVASLTNPATAKLARANKILPASDVKAKLKDPTTGQFVVVTLADAIGTTSATDPNKREGKFAWTNATYPTSASDRRAFWKRVQRAVHDGMPVTTTWLVDFNAMTKDSRFSLAELKSRGPGGAGGHLTVMHDYEAEVPGVGLLKAGTQATPQQMEAALADGTKIRFIRVKNSWGGIRPEAAETAAISGYHDLEMEYLDGPIQSCEELPDGGVNMSKCTAAVPMVDVDLPAGY